MGRRGDALRAAKKQSGVYTFTAAQLLEHDRMKRKISVLMPAKRSTCTD